MPKTISRRALNAHKKKVEVSADYDGAHVLGAVILQPWGEDRVDTSLILNQFNNCCGVAEMGNFEAYEEEGNNALYDKIICIEAALEWQKDHKKSGGHTAIIATVSEENPPQWKRALFYCGFKVVQRSAFTNAKTGHKVWILSKFL